MAAVPKIGTRIPKMGIGGRRPATKRRSLADALFPRTKQRLFGLLFGQPERSFGTVELIELVGAGRGAVQRELELLADVGLIEIEVVGLQRRYKASPRSPIFHELRSIVEKTGGIASVIRSALGVLAPRIETAILYGSVAKNEAVAGSDIDLIIVADDLTLEQAYGALEAAEARLGRRVSPTIYDAAEFAARLASKQPFLTKVLAGPHVVLIGSLDGKRAAR